MATVASLHKVRTRNIRRNCRVVYQFHRSVLISLHYIYVNVLWVYVNFVMYQFLPPLHYFGSDQDLAGMSVHVSDQVVYIYDNDLRPT